MSRAAAIAVIIISALFLLNFSSCGTNSGPCARLLYHLCDCEQDWDDRESCYSGVNQRVFTPDENEYCAQYLATCNCSNYADPDRSKQYCGDLT
jgi:hypothetical protein